MASESTVTFDISFPRWAKWYVTTAAWFAKTCGVNSDPDDLKAILMRHVKITPAYRGHIPPRPLPMPPHLFGYQPTATDPGLSTAHPPKRP